MMLLTTILQIKISWIRAELDVIVEVEINTEVSKSSMNQVILDQFQFLCLDDVDRLLGLGSILSPVVFNIYMKLLGEINWRSGTGCYLYTDDTQIYFSLPSSASSRDSVPSLNDCLTLLIGWTSWSQTNIEVGSRQNQGYKMNDIILNNLDKLLLQLVYTAKVVEKKSEICQLQEDINKNDEMVSNLSKQNNSSKENCKAWKPTYIILNEHEKYLQKELEKHQESTEKDRKMYQEYMKQYQETFNQHQAKYSENVIAQEYYEEKKNCEEIQNRVLKLSELLKQKEAEIKDLQESASLRQNTKETLMHAVVLRQQSLELDKTAEELEKNLKYFKQKLEKITEDQDNPEVQNHHEAIEEEMATSIETEKTFDESSLSKSHHLINKKPETYKLLHLPNLSQKLVQSVSTLKPLFDHTEKCAGNHPPGRDAADGWTEAEGEGERADPAEHSTVASMYFSQVENENQNCNDTTGTNNTKTSKVSSKTSLQKQTKPFRLLDHQKQTSSNQWFEIESTEIAEKEDDYTGRKEEEEKSKESTFPSKDGQAESYIKSTGHHFLRTPESNILPKTPDSSGMKTAYDLLHSESEGSTSKSPAFSFLTGFTSKSPGFNFFDSSAFGAEMSLDQETKWSEHC
ncbi:Protein SIX6OS1 [Varanus komodoensis]|nr:Protein SIX6OS1 [Varanus komodoensis]